MSPMKALSAVGFVVASIGLLGCGPKSGSDGEAAPIGTIVESFSPSVSGRHGYVELPIGRIDFSISEPTEKPPIYDEVYDRAAKGASFVGVGWAWDSKERIPGVFTPEEPPPAVSVALVVGNRRFALEEAMKRDDDLAPDAPVDYRGGVWVAVPGSPDDATLEVEYDGVVQEVDPDDFMTGGDRGEASGLYSVRENVSRYTISCGKETVPRGVVLGSTTWCVADILRTPYFQAVGWAPDGDSWTVVTVRATPGYPMLRGDPLDLDDSGAVGSYSLDGRKPRTVLSGWQPSWGDGDSLGDVVVFDPSLGGDLRIRGDFLAEPGEARATLPVTWRTHLY